MKLNLPWIIPAIIGTAVLVAYISNKYLPDDNVVEEAAESIIESQLKLPQGSVDLTPDSKESRT